MPSPSVLIPTSVIGSYAIPSWLWTGLDAIKEGKYGPTDQRELFDDAVQVAIRDQERAGVDVITDGEMRRWYFVQGFYGRMSGLEEVGVLRKVGVYGYDSAPRYRPVERVRAEHGLGIVEEFKYARRQTDRPLKATVPGPLTLTIHIQLHDDRIYRDRLELAWEFAELINQECRALVEAGADFIQIDEPSYAIIPGTQSGWVDLFNACVKEVPAKIGLHVCFGNLGSRPRGKREYGWMFPAILEARADQFSFEFANREMKEAELWGQHGDEREFSAGVVDVKSFWVEPPEEVAARIRAVMRNVRPEKLWVSPDCGFFQLPRWLAFQKIERLVAGAAIVRRELEGR
ncbi:MAG TPA: cobalamin-independent methionine synthase II family protein [Chloroflexota bacterium]|jgi:5-methyltetrahydropteroyltriglutamate--homocysteine methyltransferase